MKRRKLADILFEDKIAGNARPEKQVHVFDFDDTLGVTQNANGVMVYRDGKPAFKNAASLKSYLLSAYGVKESDYLEPGITNISSRESSPAAYLSSAGLARIQKVIPKDRQGATGQDTEKNAYVTDGEDRLLIDFTPSSGTSIDTTTPIKKVVDRLKKSNAQGSDTIVITARQATGSGVDFEGNTVSSTNGGDMSDFLSKQGAQPTKGVLGVVGKNKGEEIIKNFIKGRNSPEEIHFYDDLRKNTEEVENAVAEKTPSELHIYGPGEFAHGEADPENPNRSFDSVEKLETRRASESRRIRKHPILERWNRLAGLHDE